MIRLDIGCGPTVEDGWIGVDPAGDGEAVDRSPAWDLPYEDGTVDKIRCHHALEHFPPEMLDETMAEWLRVLKPGGTVDVSVPDAAYVLQYLIDHPTDPWATIMVFGRKGYPGDEHRTAWDRRRLENLFEFSGFEISPSPVLWDEFHQQESIYLMAAKP